MVREQKKLKWENMQENMEREVKKQQYRREWVLEKEKRERERVQKARAEWELVEKCRVEAEIQKWKEREEKMKVVAQLKGLKIVGVEGRDRVREKKKAERVLGKEIVEEVFKEGRKGKEEDKEED